MKRLSRIKVYKLLEQYDYEIKHFFDEKITMVFAPNGSGKTILLKLINSVFSNDYLGMYELPFQSIEFQFTDSSLLVITKKLKTDENSVTSEYLHYEIINNSLNDSLNHSFEVEFTKELPPLNSITRNLPFMRRIAPREWFDTVQKRRLKLNEVLDEYSELFNMSYNVEDNKKDLIKDLLSVQLIETNRLHDLKSLEENWRRRGYNNDSYYEEIETNTVNFLSDEIRRLISNKLKEFASVSQEKDRTFPSRLVSLMELGEKRIDVNSISKKLGELDDYRRKLSTIGLIDSQNETFRGFTENPGSYVANVLALYIEDTKEKLAVFNELEQRITLFLKIINDKYKDKKLIIDKNEGFIIKLKSGRELKNINHLSSGEQHILVMYFNLLFEEVPRQNKLVLIDEPEISLHIEWQQDFLSDLQEIKKLTNVDFIVATHSPDIMNGHWEISVGLEDEGDR
ncbi:AAA family ATPase [Neobacillus jeddahensis]|uniref:AAA family ATPase n=1 Tax=Neobacillus jeddahensis TaxID=1461580 RepID=UPI00058FB0CB|nr:AAA family ATPase [Neobacillus jeddahensis]